MKTQAEIRERFDRFQIDMADPLGFRTGALVEAMEYETARDLVKEGVGPDDWQAPDVAKTAREYLKFAVGKAMNHRGISASRSIEKLEEWLWVLDEHALLQRFEAAEYPQYGAPKLAVLIEAWNIQHDDSTDQGWIRMMQGLPCSEDCMEGCSR